jgi:hypothetical protein
MSTAVAWTRFTGAVLIASTLAGCAAGDGREGAVELGVEGLANANPSIAASGSFVGVAWAARTADGATDIHAATSRDGGLTFQPPARVNRVTGQASVSGEQPPRIALVPGADGAAEPSVVVLWTARAEAGTRLVSARSRDGGRSFGAEEPVPGSEATGNRGWQSMALDAKGDLMAVWLDHRHVPARTAGGAAMESGPAGAHQHHAASPQPAADGVARAQFSRILFASLADPASAIAIAPGVCYCCKTSIAMGPDGRVVAAWRHVYEGNVRDIALATSTDGGRTFAPPVRVSEDNWVLDGCPENGPAIAVDGSNAIQVVWPTLISGASAAKPAMALFHAASADGRRFTARQPMPTEGVPGHPQVALGPAGTIVVAWDELLDGARRIVVARGDVAEGGAFQFVRESVGREPGTDPAVAPLADGAIVAWTHGTTGRTAIRVARHPLAR